jgi:pSer/pThr/pTyr-binding forkhead associated (FHA) protein
MNGVIFLILRIIMAATLYIFLGWSLLIIWKDLKHQRDVIISQKTPSLSIHIKENDSDLTHKYQGHEIMIGRDPICDCSLSSEQVSANHARLSYHHNQWWVEDLNSKNGSFLNDELVLAPTVVVNGDELLCGDVLLTILLEDN